MVRRGRLNRRRRRPALNRLTMNVEFARAFDGGDGDAPRRTVEAPAYEGAGDEWRRRDDKSKQPRGGTPGPMH